MSGLGIGVGVGEGVIVGSGDGVGDGIGVGVEVFAGAGERSGVGDGSGADVVQAAMLMTIAMKSRFRMGMCPSYHSQTNALTPSQGHVMPINRAAARAR